MQRKKKKPRRSRANLQVGRPPGNPPSYSKFGDDEILVMLDWHLSTDEKQLFASAMGAEVRAVLDRLHLYVNVGVAVSVADLAGYLSRHANNIADPFTPEGHIAAMAAAFGEGRRVLDDPAFQEFAKSQARDCGIIDAVLTYVRRGVVMN